MKLALCSLCRASWCHRNSRERWLSLSRSENQAQYCQMTATTWMGEIHHPNRLMYSKSYFPESEWRLFNSRETGLQTALYLYLLPNHHSMLQVRPCKNFSLRIKKTVHACIVIASIYMCCSTICVLTLTISLWIQIVFSDIMVNKNKWFGKKSWV